MFDADRPGAQGVAGAGDNFVPNEGVLCGAFGTSGHWFFRFIAQEILADEIGKAKARSLEQPSACLAEFIPEHLLAQNENGKHGRSGIFTKKTTFWDFLSQAINADGSCAEVVSKLWASRSSVSGE